MYGRRRQACGRPRTIKVPLAEWEVCRPEAHPGYIRWKEFVANQRRLADNTSRYDAGHASVPRQGAALLQGIALCGRRMGLRYTGPWGDYPVYCYRDQTGAPLCQEVRALAVDARVEAIVAKSREPRRSSASSTARLRCPWAASIAPFSWATPRLLRLAAMP